MVLILYLYDILFFLVFDGLVVLQFFGCELPTCSLVNNIQDFLSPVLHKIGPEAKYQKCKECRSCVCMYVCERACSYFAFSTSDSFSSLWAFNFSTSVSFSFFTKSISS